MNLIPGIANLHIYGPITCCILPSRRATNEHQEREREREELQLTLSKCRFCAYLEHCEAQAKKNSRTAATINTGNGCGMFRDSGR